jgi:hypothetical protein
MQALGRLTMRTLTNNECRRWVKSQGLVYQPFRQGAPVAGQFSIEDAKDDGEAARRAVLAVCGQASQALLVIEDHPLTYDDRRAQLAQLRSSHGGTRSLEDAPGHLLNRQDDDTLAALLRVCIGPGSWWSTYIYLAPIQSTMLVWESSLVDLWSERPSDYSLLKHDLRDTTAA